MQSKTLIRWAGYAAALPCLTAWALVRLWVVLGGRLPGVFLAAAALAFSGGILWAVRRFFRAFPRYAEPLWPPRPTPELFVTTAAFVLGGVFDLSYRLGNLDGRFVARPLIRLLCHGGNALAVAFLALLLCVACKDMKSLGKVRLGEFVAVCAAVNAVTLLYVLTTRTVYVWDTAGYWTVARQLAGQPLGLSQLRAVLGTTIDLDYNYLLAFPISLLMRVFGGSRAVFVFAISNLYLLPGCWGLCVLGKGRKWSGPLLCALFPMLLYTGLVGFVDVASCSLAVWAFAVYFSDRDSVSRGLLTGALLVGTFLLRRYFFFFAAAFGVAALVSKLVFDRKRWGDFLALFAACAMCGLTFTYRFLLDKVLASNYRDLYSAYALGLRSDVLLFTRYFGVVLLVGLTVYGAVVAFRGKDAPHRSHMLFVLTQLAVCAVAFTSVQSHGQQHLLLYLPALAVLAAALLRTLERRQVIAGCLAALMCFLTLLPRPQPASLNELKYPNLLPGFTFWGPRRSDIDDLLALSDELDSLSRRQGGATVAVCASSLLLNTDTLSNLRPSLNLPEREDGINYFYISSVDKRDAFSWHMLLADYLVVGDPVQVHLGEENQQVVALVAHAVLDGQGLGSAYERLESVYHLSDGSAVSIYRRTREITPAEKQAISDALSARYPEYAALYKVP